jgi:hypothetical protein
MTQQVDFLTNGSNFNPNAMAISRRRDRKTSRESVRK